MLEYESMKVLFEILAIPRNRKKKHQIDTFGWQMVEVMHQHVMVTTRATFIVAQYVSINFDEVSALDNQFQLLIHCYVMENWVRIPILISFNHVLEGFGSNNLTKVIMEALTTKGGMLKDQVVSKLMSFGANNINVFQSTKSSVTKQIQAD